MLNSLTLLRQGAERNIESVYSYTYKHLDKDHISKAICWEESKVDIDAFKAILAITPMLVMIGFLCAVFSSGWVDKRKEIHNDKPQDS